MTVSGDEFKLLAAWIRAACGIVLEDDKRYLVETRLARLAEEQGCSNFSAFYLKLKGDTSGVLARLILDRITTQETSFFRDQAPFDMLAYKILPDIIDRKRSLGRPGPASLRIWSAACSTGQEVYSIAMSAIEALGSDLPKIKLTILGTDISDAALAKASRGRYTKLDIGRGLAAPKLNAYFKETPSGEFAVSDELRAMVVFRQHNLLSDFSPLGSWDVVFCRNVAIYFSEDEKKRLFNRISTTLEPSGALIIGATESLQGLCPQYVSKRYVRSVYYQLREG